MAKFRNLDFDLCGSMTDKEFRDTLGAVSAYCIYEDANGIHNAGVKASNELFYNGSLSAKNPTAIIAIGAGVAGLIRCFRGKTSLTKVYTEGWDTSKLQALGSTFYECTNLTSADLSHFDTSSLTGISYLFYGCTSLASVGLPTLPTECASAGILFGCSSLTDLYFGEGCKTYVGLDLSSCPLSYQSVLNVLNALADTPDSGATITFKSGLYAGFTADQKAVIDALVTAKVALGWTIANMS